jgi:uncharacterized membrane protein/GT2 family glycosyltransferase
VSKKLPLISVVVCSFNGVAVISDALKAIKAQKWAGKLEIIVVDDGSTDDTYKIAKSLKGIKVIKNKQNLGIARSRNTGIKAAKGEIIAFTDDDCRPRPTWIKELYACYTSDKIMGVGGDVISKDRSSLTLRYLDANRPFKPLENKIFKSKNTFCRFTSYLKDLTGLSRPTPNRKRSVYSITTANASFRKTALKKIGMFDERFIFAGEDVDLCKRLNKAHPESLWFAPKAKVIHKYDGHLRNTLRRSKARAVGNAQLSRKHNDFKVAPYPFPLLVPLTILLGLINPWYLLTPFILVLAIYSQGTRLVIRRSLEPLLYGYIQFAQEWYSNLGFIKGWWKFRNTFDKTKVQSKKLTPKSIESRFVKAFSEKDFNFSISSGRSLFRKKIDRNNKFLSEAGIIVSILSLVLLATLVKSSTVFHIPVAIAIILVPGYMLLRGFGAENEHRLPAMLKLALMSCLGIAWIMLIGLAIDVILPVFGCKHPLSSLILPLLFVLATGALIPWALRYRIAPKKKSSYKVNKETVTLYVLLALTVLLSFCGTRLLNNGYTNILTILAFIVGIVSIAFAVIREKKLPKNTFPIVLFVISLASVWSYSLRSNYVFGWDIQQEFQVFQHTLSNGRWILGAKHGLYDAMLSLTILPVTVVKIARISGLTFFKLISPLLFSFAPVILYYTYRIFTKRWVSFIASLLIISQFAYMQQFSALVRQQIAFLFFAGILYLIVQNRLTKKSRNTLLIWFTLALVVSHYSTTYLAIIFFGGTYIISKLIQLFIKKYRNKEIPDSKKYIQSWMIIVLIISAIIWYGPATHSSSFLQRITQKHDYSHDISSIYNDIKDKFRSPSYNPKTSQEYLNTIGNQYKLNHKGLKYYPAAANSTIKPLTPQAIKAHVPILKTFIDGIEHVLNYGWWILGGFGILATIYSAYKRIEYRKLELGVLGLIGIIAFGAIRTIPYLQTIYNPTRLNEQVLMFVALPAILMLIWLFRGLSIKIARTAVVTLILISFAAATGIITQFIGGGLPTANLNNFGADYNNLYIHQSDIASAQWLGINSNHRDIIYADTHSSLPLTSSNKNIGYQFHDITPKTISVNSFVYADYANIKNGIATTEVTTIYLNYQFPESFLQQNKNLVYSNGDSEVFK